ncbi:hypothetical protein [Paenibacillus ginsengarvi]|uniref:Uncharacterized protein n=1 Tax=Paenibacillus ginsengarvi TaxID=400777 RepID=A0A3B0CLI9_9BACL|nr:hypothetical protein [Paenibacillus ginsengarvi]RKN84866.1 hypothetical protein D7M11_10040 [Paenibacillus ginsengarvi]
MTTSGTKTQYPSFSGIYPHLSWTNGTERASSPECGTGAVVAWAGKLWYLTYPPHSYRGSHDKLYSLDEELNASVHPLSVGGTHASRMIHAESKQLIIGPYFIDEAGTVRVVPPGDMQGRLTGVARHWSDPAEKVVFYTMESGLYEVNVHTLEVRVLFADPNGTKEDIRLLPGKHGKGAYTGQGRLAVSNNGEGGVLAEWKGKGDPGKRSSWTIVDANKYTEITGPGGLYGSPDESSPLWALGWDDKSVLLNVCQSGRWSRFRLPMGSFTHSADDGWFTEWPRIRDVGADRWLMDMFGMLYEFPSSFGMDDRSGIRPIAVHHKMIVDFESWNGRLVLGCNDASMQGNGLLGRCQSNLLFTSLEELVQMGKPAGWGSVWAEEPVEAEQPSEPFLFAGFERRVLHVSHRERRPLSFRIEMDRRGTGEWTLYERLNVGADGYGYLLFPADLNAEWVRIVPESSASSVSAAFRYNPAEGNGIDPHAISGLADAGEQTARSEAIVYASGDIDMPLHVAAARLDKQGRITATGFYEVTGDLTFRAKPEAVAELNTVQRHAPASDFEVDRASVLIVDPSGNRYRLPKGHSDFDRPSAFGARRGIREVVTERKLMNVHGSFYELPDERSGGYRKLQPVCTHNKLIYDYCSWRGMLVLSGVTEEEGHSAHTIRSEDGTVQLWLGNVDDLRKFGHPAGIGGPWNDSEVMSGVPSDPYLMAGYLDKSVEIRHRSPAPAQIKIEVDYSAEGNWVCYDTVTVQPGETFRLAFPDGYSAHWVRLVADRNMRATAMFTYR